MISITVSLHRLNGETVASNVELTVDPHESVAAFWRLLYDQVTCVTCELPPFWLVTFSSDRCCEVLTKYATPKIYALNGTPLVEICNDPLRDGDHVNFQVIPVESELVRIMTKHPDCIPVICERWPGAVLPDIGKKKILIPPTMLFGEFKYLVHRHIHETINQTASAMTFVNTFHLFTKPRIVSNTGANTAELTNRIEPKNGALMSDVYEQHKGDDGLLYITYWSGRPVLD